MRGSNTLGTIPNEVVNAAFDNEWSPCKAWREHLRLTQSEVAKRMGISQSAYAQMELSTRPRKTTLIKISKAMGLTYEQLAW